MARGRSVCRRSFLKEASAAAFGVPLVVKASALGADGTTAPSERITLGGLGLGARGRGVLRSLSAARDVQPIAACDLLRSRLAQPKSQGLAVYTDFRDLL